MSDIDLVILWTNGMVMVISSAHESPPRQMPEYQGRYEDVRDRILADAPEGAKFSICNWQTKIGKEISRKEFKNGPKTNGAH